MYKLTGNDFHGNPLNSVVLVELNKWIPMDPENTDYQEYLAWLAEGNEPLPADN